MRTRQRLKERIVTMNVITALRHLSHLTINEATLVNFIVQQPEEVINMNPSELSQKAYVSISTIYRLINKLNLSGMNELKLELAKSIQEQNSDSPPINIDYPIIEEDDQFSIMNNLKSVYEQTLQETAHLSDPETLTQIGDLMSSAKHIDIYTSSANIFFAKNFKFQMQEIGCMVNVPVDEYMQRLSAANSTSSHLAIVISFGGRGANIQDIMELLNVNQVPIILITSAEHNYLHEQAKHTVFMSSLENHYNKISSFSTRMSLLYILDTLYSIYFNKKYKENIHYKLTNYQKMNKKLV